MSKSLFNLTGLATIGTGIIDPFFYYLSLQNSKKLTPEQREPMMVQEVVHQALNVLIDIVGWYGIAKLAGRLFSKHPRKLHFEFVAATIGLFVGKAIVRPLVTPWMTDWWDEKFGKSQKSSPSIEPPRFYIPVSQPNPREDVVTWAGQHKPLTAPYSFQHYSQTRFLPPGQLFTPQARLN